MKREWNGEIERKSRRKERQRGYIKEEERRKEEKEKNRCKECVCERERRVSEGTIGRV